MSESSTQNIERKAYFSEVYAASQCILPEHDKAMEQWLVEKIGAHLMKFYIVRLEKRSITMEGHTHLVTVEINDPAVIPHTEDSLTWRPLSNPVLHVPLVLPRDFMARFILDKAMIDVVQGGLGINIEDEEIKKLLYRKFVNTADRVSGILSQVTKEN